VCLLPPAVETYQNRPVGISTTGIPVIRCIE
jgi:hypothetical protein